MKKSKIIVPALAMIGLSAVASVTGSVAWFTAQRTGNITTDNFAIVKTDGNLTVTTAAGVGTTKTDAEANEIKVISSSALANASFNPLTRKLYTAAGTNESGVATGFIEVDAGTGFKTNPVEGAHAYRIGSSTIYYAFTWDVTVSYAWEQDQRNINIFFDYNASSMQAKKPNGDDLEEGDVAETAKGFRIAIMNKEDTPAHTIVYSGLQAAAEFKGTFGTAAANVDVYGNGSLANADKKYSYFATDKYAFSNTAVGSATSHGGSINHATDGSANQTIREDYLATLTYNAEGANTTLRCVAWYEGNDSSIITDNDLQSVVSTIGFYSAIAA